MSKHPVSLKFAAAIGVGILILGFLLFLHSLGSGAGFGAVSLMVIGAISVVTTVVVAIVRTLRAK